MDTIVALASGTGRAGVAVTRVSGPKAYEVANRIAGSLPDPRHAALRTLRTAEGGIIDEALVLVFPHDGSFTGETVVEFQTHGSPAVVQALLATLTSYPQVRIAEPGEFTRRALENERLSLTEVEALGDLIDAETEVQRKQAVGQAGGALAARAEEIRASLLRALALLEVSIDFSDEEIPEDVIPEVLAQADAASRSLKKEVDGFRAAERVRTGFVVAIVGAPNVGKSTLLNHLAGREAAITSEMAGTTRDVIEVRMDLEGIPVTVLDTAGLRDASDAVERIGVARTKERARAADLRVFLGHSSLTEVEDLFVEGDVLVGSKADITQSSGLAVSGLTGKGVPELVGEITQVLGDRVATAGVAVRQRHADGMARAAEELARGRVLLVSANPEVEIVAEQIRRAIRHIDGLVGRVDVEHILDEIFSRFCLGK